MLNDEQKEKLREIIDNELFEIEMEIDDLKEMTKPIGPDNSYGRLSRMDAINNKANMEASLRMKEKRFIDLKTAKRNIDKDSFGKCKNCGNDIEFERLQFMPESTHCMNCKG